MAEKSIPQTMDPRSTGSEFGSASLGAHSSVDLKGGAIPAVLVSVTPRKRITSADVIAVANGSANKGSYKGDLDSSKSRGPKHDLANILGDIDARLKSESDQERKAESALREALMHTAHEQTVKQIEKINADKHEKNIEANAKELEQNIEANAKELEQNIEANAKEVERKNAEASKENERHQREAYSESEAHVRTM